MNEREVSVIGAGGMLGRAVVEALKASGYYVPVPYTKRDFNIGSGLDSETLLDDKKVINCAGIVRGREDVLAREMGWVNGIGPLYISLYARRLIQVSTDCVFDGTKGPYVESDEPTPIDNYGMSKLIGEMRYGPHLTVRTSFIGFGQRGLVRWLLDHPQGATVPGFRRWFWNGLYVGTVARQLVRLLDDPMTGIVHIEGPIISKYELLDMVAKAIRPDLHVSPSVSQDSNMILKSERLVWGDAPDTTFSWTEMIEELKADYEAMK